MKILAFNTVGSSTQIAIKNGEKEYFKEITFSKHSETFFPSLERELAPLNLKVADFDCVACVVGPGSFTGVRIGLSVAKAFAYSLKIPLVTITSLELLAFGVPSKKPICAVIDAGSGLVYHQTFDTVPLYKPRVDTIKHLKGFLHANYNDNITFVYNQNNEHDDFSSEYGKSNDFSPRSLLNIAKIKFENQKFTDAVTAAPVYIRVSQAEQFLGKDFEFVEASLNNLDEILVLEGQNDEWDLKWNEIGIRQSFDNPSYHCYIFRIANLPKGMISILDLGDEAEILRVVVENSVRLCGVATKMLKILFETLKQKGCREVFLEVNNQNYPAMSLYKKLGFSEIGRRESYYGRNEDAVTMKKIL